MNEAEIRKYASLMRELDLTGIEIDEKQGVIRLERERDGAGAGSLLADAAPAQNAAASGMQGSAAQYSAAQYSAAQYSAGAQYSPLSEAPAFEAKPQAAQYYAAANLESVKSPTVGIFYAAPAENADPYVKAGDTVHKGDVLCIIEAMKLMNEVLAEKDGVIEEICAQNGQVVEYGTELFRIREMSA